MLSSTATTRMAVMPAPTFEQISLIVSSRTPTGTPAVAAALFSMTIAEELEKVAWAVAVKPAPAGAALARAAEHQETGKLRHNQEIAKRGYARKEGLSMVLSALSH